MAKGWSTIYTNKDTTPATTIKAERHFNNTIRNTPSLPVEKLKANSEAAYVKKIAEEDKLLDAFDNKLLKSKNAIKQAIQLKKEREAAAKKQKAETEAPQEVAN